MHLKRQKAPKKWPVPRKGRVFIAKPVFNLKNGVPLLIVLRDMLKVAQNRKEVKMAIHNGDILFNGKKIKEERQGVLLFDVITLVPLKKNYILGIGLNGKFALEEISDKESNLKIAKVIGKKILKGKKVQINLSDGRNFISDMECKVNDSVVVNLKNNKIDKCLPLKEKSQMIVFEGKHAGERGVIEKVNEETKMVETNVNKKKVNVLIKQIMVLD